MSSLRDVARWPLGVGNHLPGNAIFILEPAPVLRIFISCSELLPVMVYVCLGFTVDLERDCFIKGKNRPPIECHKCLSIQFKSYTHDAASRFTMDFKSCFTIVSN